MKEFSVQLWSCHPESDNAECWSTLDCETLQEAQGVFESPEGFFGADLGESPYIEIVRNLSQKGGMIYVESLHVRQRMTDDQIKNMKLRQQREDTSWGAEIAYQAGMGLGCESYNEHMGF